jgi:hypothetical protein
MSPRGRNVTWAGAALFVVAGWFAGRAAWGAGSSPEYGSYFDILVPAGSVVLGAPVAATAGVMLTCSRWVRRAGYVMLAVATAELTYLASFSFFGGFCLDPGDVCQTTWASRLVALAVAEACLVPGWWLQRRRATGDRLDMRRTGS